MKNNYFLAFCFLTFCIPGISYTASAQIGINTTTPQKQLHINVATDTADGIEIESNSFSGELLTERSGQRQTFILNNTVSTGNYEFRFANSKRFNITENGFYPSVNASNNTVTGALDIGRFDFHFRRIYTQAIHTNDNGSNGGLRINIGSGGGTQSDYNFSDFAFYPEVSMVKDLGRNGNYWRNLFYTNAYTPSDRRLKTAINPLSYNLETLMKLATYEYVYTFDTEQKKHFGFMAQQLEEVIPELVHRATNEEGSLSINYTELIPILIKALQEQQQHIHHQNIKIDAIEKRISGL